MLLDVKDLNVYYGTIHALRDVSFSVGEGEIVTLIGANGAGKSTILKTVSGLIRPRSGSVSLRGQNIVSVPAHKIVGMGVAHVPEGRKPFPALTVRENLLCGAYTRKNRQEINEVMERVFQRFPRLKERLNQPAGTLSGGEQQMMAMGRGLMASPQLLMLDEPSMGLSPIMVEQIFEIIEAINRAGTSILLVEQNAYMALSIASRAYVLETGSIVLAGDAKEVSENPKVRAAYLGDTVAQV